MMQALLAGWVVGVAVAIPPGALSLAVFTQALDRGRKAAFDVVAGGLMTEFVFALLGFMGIGVAEDAGQGTSLRLVSCVVILLLGFRYAFGTVRVARNSVPAPERSGGNRVLLGVLLGGTTPTIAAAYFVLAGFVHSFDFFPPTAENNVAAALGATAGSLSWLAVVVHVIRHTRTSLDPSVLRSVTRGSGGLLLAIGLYYTIDFIRLTAGQ